MHYCYEQNSNIGIKISTFYSIQLHTVSTFDSTTLLQTLGECTVIVNVTPLNACVGRVGDECNTGATNVTPVTGSITHHTSLDDQKRNSTKNGTKYS